ncbi:hypothetical protein PYCC9005_002089 [Savitreella phatthalungensis]
MVKPELDATRDYYGALGLRSCNVSQVDIRRAYLELARTHHPDKNPGHENEYHAKFQLITTAYEVLKDPVTKRSYDSVRPRVARAAKPPPSATRPSPKRQTKSDPKWQPPWDGPPKPSYSTKPAHMPQQASFARPSVPRSSKPGPQINNTTRPSAPTAKKGTSAYAGSRDIPSFSTPQAQQPKVSLSDRRGETFRATPSSTRVPLSDNDSSGDSDTDLDIGGENAVPSGSDSETDNLPKARPRSQFARAARAGLSGATPVPPRNSSPASNSFATPPPSAFSFVLPDSLRSKSSTGSPFAAVPDLNFAGGSPSFGHRTVKASADTLLKARSRLEALKALQEALAEESAVLTEMLVNPSHPALLAQSLTTKATTNDAVTSFLKRE